jgi:hypothetical protein
MLSGDQASLPTEVRNLFEGMRTTKYYRHENKPLGVVASRSSGRCWRAKRWGDYRLARDGETFAAAGGGEAVGRCQCYQSGVLAKWKMGIK